MDLIVISAIFPNINLLNILMEMLYVFVSRVAVSIASGYGLDDRTIEVRSLAEAKGFFL
jgi:hypothetical protein